MQPIDLDPDAGAPDAADPIEEPPPGAIDPYEDAFTASRFEADAAEAASPEPNVLPLDPAKRRPRKPRPKASASSTPSSQRSTPVDPSVKPTYGLLCRVLREHYGTRLSYDQMREEPCLDRMPLRDADLGRVRELLERDHGVAFAGENVAAGVRQIAEEHSFHPVRDYLRSLLWDGVVRLPRVGPEILGITGELEIAMLRRFFIAAVARGIVPGCKVDTALVLVGEQGHRKSSFFAVLGGEWFCDTHVDVADKDGMLQLAATWLYEWPEIDRVTKRRHASDVKAFLSKRDDAFRPPFGRTVIRHPRGCIIVGTTNEPRYLTDETGSRRFWTCTIGKSIDLPLVIAWRDQLWAEAVVAYGDGSGDGVHGEPWWLTQVEEAAREEHAGDAHSVDDEDPWSTQIARWLRTSWEGHPRRVGPPTNAGDVLTLERIMDEALKIDAPRRDSQARFRCCKILRDLGYTNPRVRVPEAGRLRHWVTSAGLAAIQAAWRTEEADAAEAANLEAATAETAALEAAALEAAARGTDATETTFDWSASPPADAQPKEAAHALTD